MTILVNPQNEIVAISLAWYPTSFDADTKNVSNRCIIKSKPSLSRKNESKKNRSENISSKQIKSHGFILYFSRYVFIEVPSSMEK